MVDVLESEPANCLSLSKSEGSTANVRQNNPTRQMIGLQRRTRSAVTVASRALALCDEGFLGRI